MAQVCISIFTVEYVGRVMSVPFSSFLDNSTQLGIDIFQRKFVYLGESRMNRLWNYITEVRVRVADNEPTKLIRGFEILHTTKHTLP
jgi:hypothetical protein